MRAPVALASLLVACGTSASSPDAGTPTDAPAIADAGPISLRACGVVPGCFFLTPVESGLPADGAGAGEDQIALRPDGARGELLVFLNGSGGTPRGPVTDPANNFYTVARGEGLHVLAVSYRSDEAVGRLCPATSATRDACFEATRRAILTGTFIDGAAPELAGIEAHEGVYARVAAALRALDAGDPEGGWDAYLDASALDPAGAIRWDRVIVSGHSQGGGHAALLGKLHAVARVVMLASPCDAVGGAPASWLTRTAAFATGAERYFALGARGDEICGTQFDAWVALGMSEDAGDDQAELCGSVTAHGAPVACVENAARWSAMLR